MTARRIALIIAIVAAVLLTAPGCKKKTEPTMSGNGLEPAPLAQEVVLTIAPDFSLMDSTGRKITLDDHEGSIVVLEWTSYECPFVDKHYEPGGMVMLDTAQKYADRNVIWLAINSSHTATAAKNEAWRQKHKIPYPVLDDHLGVVGKQYGATHTPHMIVMDKERRVIYNGAMDNDPQRTMQPLQRISYVDKAINEYLSGKPVSTPKTTPVGCTVKYAPASAAVEMKN